MNFSAISVEGESRQVSVDGLGSVWCLHEDDSEMVFAACKATYFIVLPHKVRSILQCRLLHCPADGFPCCCKMPDHSVTCNVSKYEHLLSDSRVDVPENQMPNHWPHRQSFVSSKTELIYFYCVLAAGGKSWKTQDVSKSTLIRFTRKTYLST